VGLILLRVQTSLFFAFMQKMFSWKGRTSTDNITGMPFSSESATVCCYQFIDSREGRDEDSTQ
jgi:hypothetical protein